MRFIKSIKRVDSSSFCGDFTIYSENVWNVRRDYLEKVENNQLLFLAWINNKVAVK